MEWIIASHNSDEDRIVFKRIDATVEEMKKQLMSIISTARKELETHDFYELGTECIEEIEESFDNITGELKELHAYACYQNCHIEYNAIISNMIEVLKKEKNHE